MPLQADADPAPKRARRSEADVGKSQEESDDWVHEAHSLLKRCQSHKKGFYFKEPVDPIALDILDYFEVITDPMDFSTVGKKITHGTYTEKVFCACIPDAGRSIIVRLSSSLSSQSSRAEFC